MEIVNEQMPWDSQDTAIFAGFLNTVTGKRIVGKVMESAPVLMSGGDINSILIRSGELRGFSDAIRSLLSLQAVVAPPVADVTNYPSPEDDSAWGDGNVLTP